MSPQKKPVHQKKRIHRKKPEQQYSPTGRRTRHDRGKPRLTTRDRFALTWVGEQYAMRFDQVQELLGQRAGHGATYEDEIGDSATHNVLDHWKKGKWVDTRRLDETGQVWVWLTKKGLTALSLPYQYLHAPNLGEEKLKHVSAITDVRLEHDDGTPGTQWTSERTLLQGTHRRRGDARVHRPDAVLTIGDDLIAIEVELSRKTESLLSHVLLSLVQDRDYHGQAYHDLKAQKGEAAAQRECWYARCCYTCVFYFARPTIRQHIRRVLGKLVHRGDMSMDEAKRISLWWYPLSVTRKQIAQEDQERKAPLDLGEDTGMVFEDQWE